MILSRHPLRFFKILMLMALFSFNHCWAEITAPPGGQMSSGEEQYAWDSKPYRNISAGNCKDCHQEIYRQWKGSMHAQSTALSDPIHGAFYQALIGDPRKEGLTKKGKYPVCLKCHAPSAALDKVTKLDALPVYNEGVSCTSCHLFKQFKGTKRIDGKLNLGTDAYEMASVLQGPSGKVFTQKPLSGDIDTAASYHPYPIESNTTLLRTTQVCLGCHDQRNNFHGVPLCATGDEFKDAQHFNCQQCHMPVNNGYADHSMAGGHVQAMLERGVVLTLETTKQNGIINADVTLVNTLPHKLPTGAPFRNMYLKVTAYNVKGERVWQNFQKNPFIEAPDSVLRLILLDGNGKPTIPPKAKQLGKDTRLKPKETRTWQYTIPSEEVAKVNVQLYYDLLWPKLKKKFKSIPAELKKPKVIARAEQRI
ncbi:cytochrome c family protein [Candidatus Parabeggiatoa sp. HSG14]|uniref:cytochrome c family protein n=1 Tax=Candidatus Parabeggiatoa sp. HSG14 TaxID=3055593 RepID=UPI0025A7C21E|nr:cytochrome c family protein [Thiotrichales bacterium HSG14]